MEQIAQTIKNFILNDVNPELAKLADQTVTLPAVEENNIIFGTVDLSRYEKAVVVSILPEQQEPDDGYINGFSDRSEFVVTFLFQKEKYSLLVSRMCRYAKAFRTAQAKNPSMSDNIEESEITQIDFFPDTGAVPQQMTAFEINLAVVSEEPLAPYEEPSPSPEPEPTPEPTPDPDPEPEADGNNDFIG